jgi:hypothetical protein
VYQTHVPGRSSATLGAMKFISFVAAPMVWASCAFAAGPPLQCDIGPITRTFGSVPWLVYACRDGKSVALISAPGSPATPSYFFLSPHGTSYRIIGESNAPKDITDAALADLQHLSDSDFLKLVRDAQGER